MVDLQAPVERARNLSEAIFERQYRDGMRIIQSSEWAADIYTLILNQCPHLPEEEVVRLFRNRHRSDAEEVLGEALFKEYNLARSRRRR